MLARITSCSFALLLGATSLLAASPDGSSTTFQISSPTGIPGKVLSPGTYNLQVVDHVNDRYVLRVTNKAGKDAAFFLGIPKNDLTTNSTLAYWKNPVQGDTYLRGWNVKGQNAALTFAYPKNDAVAIAKANDTQVPAIDPAGDGIVNNTGLSREEMHVVTLWLLTPTSVGPNSPGGISAARYQEVARVERKPVIARLPHTASPLPLVALLGLFSLAGAGALTRRRLTEGTR
jgi:hypothetical protein